MIAWILKQLGTLSLWLLSMLPWEYIALLVAAVIVVSWIVTWMTKRIGKFLPIALTITTVLLLIAGYPPPPPPPPPRIEYVTKEVVKYVKDDSEIRRLKDLLERSQEMLDVANGKFATAVADKDEAEAKLAALEASGADKDEKLAALEEAMKKKLKTKAAKEREAQLKKDRIAMNNFILAQIDAWIAAGLSQAMIQENLRSP